MSNAHKKDAGQLVVAIFINDRQDIGESWPLEPPWSIGYVLGYIVYIYSIVTSTK